MPVCQVSASSNAAVCVPVMCGLCSTDQNNNQIFQQRGPTCQSYTMMGYAYYYPECPSPFECFLDEASLLAAVNMCGMPPPPPPSPLILFAEHKPLAFAASAQPPR